MSPPVRVRIAPSPTGDPHVGTAYIALFNYAFAKKHGGKFVLRIEDTDRARSTAASEAAILRALGWVGLAWDERLEAVRHEQRRQELFGGYDRLCRGRPDEEGAERAAAGEPFVVRMKMPPTGETAFIDRLRGAVKFENAQIDDQILLKTDGFPTYHLANVVDDHL